MVLLDGRLVCPNHMLKSNPTAGAPLCSENGCASVAIAMISRFGHTPLCKAHALDILSSCTNWRPGDQLELNKISWAVRELIEQQPGSESKAISAAFEQLVAVSGNGEGDAACS